METFSTFIIPAFIVLCVSCGLYAKTPVYEAFVEGAKQGFEIAIRIIPYVVAFVFAVAFFRVGGGFELLSRLLSPVLSLIHMPAEVLPLAITRPFSGGAANGILASILKEYGPDSYTGLLASVMMGSSETLFYTIALYCGSVGVKKTRYTVGASLIAEVAGIAAAITFVNIFL